MMQIFQTIASLRQVLEPIRKSGQTIGFVPTMGALHEGHLSLLKKAKAENTVVVCSIFVNPTQFNNPSDLEKYPRTTEADIKLLEEATCDFLFLPQPSEIYPKPSQTRLDFGILETLMEGKFRPGHFAGVGLVVSKLFHIVEPQKAYFGQKDLQQCAIIRQLINDLNFDIQLCICPTLRESDGLAMSSRNRRLTDEQRQKAPIIYQQLTQAAQKWQAGEPLINIKKEVENCFEQPDFRLEYFEIVDKETLQPIENTNQVQDVAFCIAVFLGEVRLIDNLVINL